MQNLDAAIRQYIANENEINKADEKENELLSRYHQALSRVSGSCDTDEAAKIYNAYNEVVRHRESLSKHQQTVNQSGEVIKKHLEALKGVKITYTDRSGNDMLTYGFYLDSNGNLTHNHAGKTNNKVGM